MYVQNRHYCTNYKHHWFVVFWKLFVDADLSTSAGEVVVTGERPDEYLKTPVGKPSDAQVSTREMNDRYFGIGGHT